MCCVVADIILIMSLIQILQASILLWPCYRMVIMLALITIALCRILAYYPHYEPLWVINRYLHVCCRPLGDTNNNIDSTSSIVSAQNPDTLWAFDFIHSVYKETSICRLCFWIYLRTIQPTSNNAMPCHNVLRVLFHTNITFGLRLFSILQLEKEC